MTEVIRYTCQQPTFFPPLYIVQRATMVDAWVLFNEAQFDRYHTTYKLMDRTGREIKDSVPVQKARLKPFNTVKTADLPKFLGNLQKQLQACYGKAQNFEKQFSRFREFSITAESISGVDGLCYYSMLKTFQWLEEDIGLIAPKLVDSQLLVGPRPKNPTEWIAGCGKSLGASVYLQGTKSIESYFDARQFNGSGITVWGQNFEGSYGQPLRDATFSILDALFVLSREELRSLLLSNREEIAVAMKKTPDGLKFIKA